MMVEVDCLIATGSIGEKQKLLRKHLVSSGNWMGTGFLGKRIGIAVFCSADNKNF